MTNSDLRARAKTIVALMDQADEIKTEIADRFQDAKHAGFTVSALRAAIRIHRLDGAKRAKHDAAQADLFLYLDMLDGRITSTEAAE